MLGSLRPGTLWSSAARLTWQRELPTPSSHALCPTFRVRPEQGVPGVAARKRAVSPRTAFHGVPCPSTLEATGSYSRRDCLTRLPCAFVLLPDLDAFFHPKPSPPCFMRITPLGFQLSEVFPLRDRKRPHGYFVPSCHFSTHQAKQANSKRWYVAVAPRSCVLGESVLVLTVLPDENPPILS